MVDTGIDVGPWLRPLLIPSEHGARAERGDIFERGHWVVQPHRRLSQIVHRRPPGITAHQWNSALRTHFDFVVCDARGYAPLFAVVFDLPGERTADAQRNDRMTQVVCEAVGLGVLRIGSSALRAGSHGRRIVEYIIDARAFMTGTGGQEESAGLLPDEPLNYRDIIGRLPDGRSGFVNDLGAVARVGAVEAYATRQLADPIIRGLHVRWANGSAEGWGWLEVRDGRCLFERTRIWQHGFSCGVDPARLAEDLAAAAIGERLKHLDTVEPVLIGKDTLGRDFDDLRSRRDEMETVFGFDHVSFE
jgi:hypothetical protein